MEPHHTRTIERLIELFKDDPRYPAIIISGSVAHGNASPASDIDVLLVASEEEYARRQQEQEFSYFNFEICDYPGGYIDGKVVNLAFLQEAAERGSEPMRYAFVGAYPAYSRIPDLDKLVQSIPVYPEHERAEKIRSFYSQILVLGGYFIPQSLKRNDPYLLSHTASDLALFGGRLILAHNRILFPCHKSLMDAVRSAPDKPADFVELAERMLREPTQEHAKAFCDCVGAFQDWGVTYMQALTYFYHDVEWNWRGGRAPLEDR